MNKSAAELAEHHDKMFEAARAGGGEIYGDFDLLPAVTKAGHFRRMEIIDKLQIRDPEGATSVDFGTGPWGFACMFPKLRRSSLCVAIDVSSVALRMAAEKDRDLVPRVKYLTSDGEDIPLEDDSVDIFWGGEVVEHVREPAVFLQEIARVCRQGADIVLTTPNRDAIFYQALGQDYTIGPEHLALMSHNEFVDAAGAFFDVVACHGFESSIWPDVDSALIDPGRIDLLQKRAFDYPEVASGLILHARNNKAKYRANARSYSLIEQLWSHPQVKAASPMTPLQLFGDIHGGLIQKHESINLAIPGRRIILLFWAHNWSGETEVTCEGVTVQSNLYSRWAGFKRVVIPDLNPDAHWVSIMSTGRKREESHAAQVIFYKAMAYSY